MESRTTGARLAVAAALLDLLLFATLHLASPGVDVRREPTSAYVHTRLGLLLPVGQVAFGTAAVLVGLLWRRHRIAAVLLVLVGIAKVAQAFFPLDAPGTEPTTVGLLHNVLGNVAFWLLPVAAALLARPLLVGDHCAVAIIGLLLAPTTVLVLVGSTLDFFGIAQRTYLMLASVWVLTLAATRLHIPADHGARLPFHEK